MKASSILVTLSLSASLTSAQQWWDLFTSTGAWTAWADPNVYGPCAISCYKTASWPTPTATSDWPSYCATPPPNPIISCLSSSCSAATIPWSAITAAESSLCSAYSSCSSQYSAASSQLLPACAAWPWLRPIGGKGGPGHFWPDNWIGTSGCSYFTVTATSGGQTTGWTTTTETVVETMAGPSGTSVVTATTVISATIARADVAAQTTSLTGPATTTASPTSGDESGTVSSSSASSSHVAANTAAAVGCVNAMGLIVALTFAITVLV